MKHSSSSYPLQAYDYIRERIVNLHYKPGEYLTDAQIAEELHISRTPVREAFTRLQNEGLLINEARRGWKVYTLTLEDIHEIFDVKEALEGLVARRAAACSDEMLRQRLRDALERMRAAHDANDSVVWLRADQNLHEVLFTMAGNERVRRLVLNLNDQWHRVRIGFVALQGRIERSTQEHAEFVEAILESDDERAEQLMQQHLNNVRQELVRLLETMVIPFSQGRV